MLVSKPARNSLQSKRILQPFEQARVQRRALVIAEPGGRETCQRCELADLRFDHPVVVSVQEQCEPHTDLRGREALASTFANFWAE